MLDLAEICEIRVPAHKVVRVAGKDVLLVERFDRTIVEGRVFKHRAASAATVFRADEEYARTNFTGSYMRLSRELARWGLDIRRDRKELYRRMAFNCLTGVTDDHERNHALVATGDHFRLAPAFDLAPSKPATRARRQALAIGAAGAEATRANLLSAVDQFELTAREAEDVIDDVKARVDSRWRESFIGQGVADRDMILLSKCLDHEYFESKGPAGGASRAGF